MFFKNYQPIDTLKPYIRSIWILENEKGANIPEMILPDGCMELIFHYGDPYINDIKATGAPQPLTLVVGQIEKAITLIPTGITGIISARFEPWGFYAFTGVPASNLTNDYIDSHELFGDAVLELLERLCNVSTDEKAALLTTFLEQQLALRKQPTGIERYIDALKELEKHKGNIPVAQLAASCHVSERHFNRTINTMIGLPPKQYARILRLQAFLDSYSTNKQVPLIDALYEAGYYDQAHFIKEFKAISAYTPMQFFKGNHEMAELMLR